MEEGAIVYYLSPKDDDNYPAVAFFRKTENDRWVGTGFDVTYDQGDKLSFHVETADLTPEIPYDKRVQVVLGRINDPDVQKVRARDTASRGGSYPY